MTDAELEQIVNRVLERVRDELGDFSYSPLNGVTIAADGTVSYDFDGHVHARGLDLDAGTNDTPPDDRRVRWIAPASDPDAGQVVAQIYGFRGPSTGADGRPSQIEIRIAADVYLKVRQHGSKTAIELNVADGEKVVLDNLGNSSWMLRTGTVRSLGYGAGVLIANDIDGVEITRFREEKGVVVVDGGREDVSIDWNDVTGELTLSQAGSYLGTFVADY